MAAEHPLIDTLEAYIEAAVAHMVHPGTPPPVAEAHALSNALDAHIARCVAETLVEMRKTARLGRD